MQLGLAQSRLQFASIREEKNAGGSGFKIVQRSSRPSHGRDDGSPVGKVERLDLLGKFGRGMVHLSSEPPERQTLNLGLLPTVHQRNTLRQSHDEENDDSNFHAIR